MKIYVDHKGVPNLAGGFSSVFSGLYETILCERECFYRNGTMQGPGYLHPHGAIHIFNASHVALRRDPVRDCFRHLDDGQCAAIYAAVCAGDAADATTFEAPSV